MVEGLTSSATDQGSVAGSGWSARPCDAQRHNRRNRVLRKRRPSVAFGRGL